MIKIYLFCNAGMSTSMLATRMQEKADERQIEAVVKAISLNQMASTLSEDLPDVIMLGPQVKYKYKELFNKFKHLDRPIIMIDGVDYGMMDGDTVLTKALDTLKGE